MGKCRDKASGLCVSDRFFQPERSPKPHPLAWCGMDVLLLACLVGGLLMLFVSGFSVPVSRWFFPAALLLCGGLAGYFRSQWSRRHWLLSWTIVLLLYLLALFLRQGSFLAGARQFGNLMVYTLNQTYQGELPAAVLDTAEADTFLLLAAVPAITWLAYALFQKNSMALANLLLFPVLVLLGLCGAAKNTGALFLVLLGILLCMAYSKPKRQLRMWGGQNKQLREQNGRRFQSIQKKGAGLVLLVFLLLSAPGFFLVRPLLSVSLKPAQQISMELQGSFLTKVLKLLPELSAGAWNLNVEAVGGGVQDGALTSEEGYLLEGVEDLRLTLNTKPKEALFLKGYIGTTYQNGKWENSHGTGFDGAAINWNTEGSARIYIQNLPFLRTAFALSQEPSIAALAIEPAQLLVERENANDAYTYLPYGTFLNDYYQVSAGDGAVEGQQEQEDRFFFFFREDMETVLSAWNALDGTGNVLDRVEESYRAFCETNKQTDYPGMEALQGQVNEAIRENHWSADRNGEEITSWIRQFLAEHYRYQLNPEAVPEGADALEYFLFESKAGNSVHFASAAVVLYRMFGVPARYVVGYEVPASLFSAQSNGTYTATVQGDNAQAWAEIYVPGIGWTPRDMTPGVIGTYEEVGPGGEKIEAFVEGGAEEALPPEETPSEIPDVPASESGGRTIGEYGVEQIVKAIGCLAAVLLPVSGFVYLGWRLCRALGYVPLGSAARARRMVSVFQALYARMHRLGLPKGVSSQSEAFLTFCEGELRRRSPEAVCLVRPTVERLYQVCFGQSEATASDVSAMRRLLLASYHKKRPNAPNETRTR